METKPWYASKTLWVALLTAVAAGLNSLTDTVTDTTVLSLATVALAAVMAALRGISDKPVTLKKGDSSNGIEPPPSK